MIGLLPFRLVLTVVAVIYALLVIAGILIAQTVAGPQGGLDSLRFALIGATPIQLVLFYVFSQGWRTVWQWFPALNEWLFPDINGQWVMTIDWTRDGQSGSVAAAAVIKQDFLRISMEVHSPGSDSQTLNVVPRRDAESGRPMLYYFYQVTPHAIGGAPQPYTGAAILRFFNTTIPELRGNYWTSTPSVGHFCLRR